MNVVIRNGGNGEFRGKLVGPTLGAGRLFYTRVEGKQGEVENIS